MIPFKSYVHDQQALQVVKDQGRENDFEGKVILINGCSSGLGVHTTRALFHTGATHYVTAYDFNKVKAALKNLTVDGFETQFGTNYIAHFLLFYLVKSLLISFSTAAFHSRVVYLSSSPHRTSSVQSDNLTL
jgi:NAD(P)-dependent dehydrogenase (short-subunit alcohol dehydrogenase family)